MRKVPVTVRGPRGTTEVLLQEGQRVLAAGVQAGLSDEGFGDCGGNCCCATCCVRVLCGNFAPMREDERLLLDTLPLVTVDSRLACQLVVTSATGPVDLEWPAA